MLLVTAALAEGQNPQINSGKSGAINGYDPVAYFRENKATGGSPEFVYRWQETDWRFASKENLEIFKADPEKYAPQYGGYCAYGASQGHKAPTDPEAFAIVNGKLYLNYSKNVQKTWKADQSALIEKADKNWETLKSEK